MVVKSIAASVYSFDGLVEECHRLKSPIIVEAEAPNNFYRCNLSASEPW
jgi:hypothetical protein